MTADSYTIERHPHGVLIKGPIPVGDLVALTKGFKSQGFTFMDAGIATAMRATMALVSKTSGEAWRKEIEARGAAMTDAELAWLHGTDTGVSSLTLFSVVADNHRKTARALARHADVPYDPDDFGRCHRLLEKFPAWRSRLNDVAVAHPTWKPLVDAWDELTELYVEELPTGKAPRLYARMQALRGRK